MRRALVLGGGGPVGVAWESGLLAGLAEADADVSDAELIVGTSAGSIVGSQLALGRTPREALERQVAAAPPGRRVEMGGDMQELVQRFMRLYTSDRPLQELRAEFGAYALGAATMDEAEWLAGFAAMEGSGGDAWPAREFACTAIDASDGSFVVWRRESDVPLRLAVASSCAVPGMVPPVTINGRRYMDGGVGSTTNAEIAAGYDRILVVALTGRASAAGGAVADAAQKRFAAELDGLSEAGSSVEAIRPNDEFAQSIGINLMDFDRRVDAANIGFRQGKDEADRVRAFWR